MGTGCITTTAPNVHLHRKKQLYHTHNAHLLVTLHVDIVRSQESNGMANMLEAQQPRQLRHRHIKETRTNSLNKENSSESEAAANSAKRCDGQGYI